MLFQCFNKEITMDNNSLNLSCESNAFQGNYFVG